MSWCGSCCIYPLLCGASQPPPGSLPPFLPASVGWLAACSRCCWQHMRVRGRGKRWDVARKRSAGPLLLVAGGVGAAPLISMLRHAHEQQQEAGGPPSPITLLVRGRQQALAVVAPHQYLRSAFLAGFALCNACGFLPRG